MRLTTVLMCQLMCACIAFTLAMPTLAKQEVVEKTIDVKPGSRLRLNSTSGDINIESWEKNKVHVVVEKNAWSQEKLNAFTVSIEPSDDGVWVKGKNNENARISVSYHIRVPNNYYLDVRTGGGDINLSSMTGEVQASTSGGNINVDKIHGSIDVQTSGGSISVEKVTEIASLDTSGGSIRVGAGGQSLTVNTSGGSISIGKSDGNVQATTSGGGISIDYVKGNIKANTSGGSIQLEGSDGNVDAKTSGGNIKIGKVKGSIKADTSGGGISIGHAEGEIQAFTAGGSIKALYRNQNPDKKVSIQMETAGGDIVLAVPKNIKATVDAKIERYHRNQDLSVRSDFPLNITKEDRYVKGVGDINGGGGKIALQTVGSNIKIAAE